MRDPFVEAVQRLQEECAESEARMAVAAVEATIEVAGLRDRIARLEEALRRIAEAIPDDGDHTKVASVSELRDRACHALASDGVQKS